MQGEVSKSNLLYGFAVLSNKCNSFVLLVVRTDLDWFTCEIDSVCKSSIPQFCNSPASFMSHTHLLVGCVVVVCGLISCPHLLFFLFVLPTQYKTGGKVVWMQDVCTKSHPLLSMLMWTCTHYNINVIYNVCVHYSIQPCSSSGICK